MKPEAEVSQVELSVEEAEVALRSFNAVDYRMYRSENTEYKGGFVPEQEIAGTLVVDEVGAVALRDCLSESILYNQELLYGKFEPIYNLESKVIEQRWRPGLIQKMKDHTGVFPVNNSRLDRANGIWSAIMSYERVRKVLSGFLEQETEKAEELVA